MKMKKLICMMLAAALSMTMLAGCGGSGSQGGGKSGEEKEVYTLRIATHYNQEHLGYASLTRIKEELESKSDGRLDVTLYPSSQLGDYTLTFQELSEGTVDMALIPIPSEYDSRLEMNFIPYLVNDYAYMADAFGPDSYFCNKYTEIMSDLDIKWLGTYAEGMIGMGFASYPEGYNDVNDTSTAKANTLVRAPAIEVYNLVTQDMGYGATTIPYSDLYTAMQTGVCNGWIGGTPQLNYSDFRDVIKYYVPYNVFVENIGYMMSQKIYDELPADLQELITQTFMNEALNSYETAESADGDAIQKMKDYGIEILELTDEELTAYRNHVGEVTWPKLTGNIGEDILNELIAANS